MFDGLLRGGLGLADSVIGVGLPVAGTALGALATAGNPLGGVFGATLGQHISNAYNRSGGLSSLMNESNAQPSSPIANRQYAHGGSVLSDPHKIAEALEGFGRHGDSMLAYITPEERTELESMGGSGSINPETGLPEYFLGSILGAVGGLGSLLGNIFGGGKEESSGGDIGRILGGLGSLIKPALIGTAIGGTLGGKVHYPKDDPIQKQLLENGITPVEDFYENDFKIPQRNSVFPENEYDSNNGEFTYFDSVNPFTNFNLKKKTPGKPMYNSPAQGVNPTNTEKSRTAQMMAQLNANLSRSSQRPPKPQITKPSRTAQLNASLSRYGRGQKKFKIGGYINHDGGGQDDDVPIPTLGGGHANLSGGEYIHSADVVAALGDGNSAAGAKKLYKMDDNIRKHKTGRKKFPPKAKSIKSYLK